MLSQNYPLDSLRERTANEIRALLATTDATIYEQVSQDHIKATLITHLVNWLRLQATLAHARGYTLGISGGIDSATVAALVERATPGENRFFYLPCHSAAQDRSAAHVVADTLGIALPTVDIAPLYTATCAALGDDPDATPTPLHLMNLKATLRMAVLATVANQHSLLVAGTGNRSEIEHAGFMTKRGDGAADNEVLGLLFKRQVRAVARLLGIPEEIVTRPPTPGLRLLPDGTPLTDEEEMGMLYSEIETATRLFMEFGADLSALTVAVRQRFPENAVRVLTVCQKLGRRSWQNRHKIEPPPAAGNPQQVVPRFDPYSNGFPTWDMLQAWT